MKRNYSLLTDAYEYAMADSYLQNGKANHTGVFDIFFRAIPNGGGFAVMAGLDKVVNFIENLHFEEEDLQVLASMGYSAQFIEYLRDFRFHGDIYAFENGCPVFANEPILTVKAPMVDAQIVETALLSILNGSIEHATAARRIIEVLPEGVGVMEFGARRADGLDAAYDASVYGVMAGCVGTSNVLAARDIGIKALGTMAHSFVQTFDTELEAFMTFAKTYPDNATLLVDTYDTLRSGVPNAIKTFEWMKEQGMPLDHIGIRIDSGDLAYLSKESRRMMDEAGFPQAKITLSNALKAETIGSLVFQGACFNSLGVGDNISKPEGRLGAVYKEVAIIDENGVETPRIKVSNDHAKTINPGFKTLYRLYDKQSGFALADVMCIHTEEIPEDEMPIYSVTNKYNNKVITDYKAVNIRKTIYKNGQLVYKVPTIMESRKYCEEQMATMYPEVKRVYEPHEYYIDGTKAYIDLKDEMIKKARGEK